MIRKNREELLTIASEKYQKLQFQDDFLFCKILENNPDIAKELLEMILNVKIREVKVEKQAAIDITADGRGIRLDVYLEDDNNTVYDLEMQTTKQRDLGKRSRYYQGMMDLNMISRGAKFQALKKTFIIFICMSDPYHEDRHIYTFENTCRESPELKMGDDTMKIFLNADGKKNDVSADMLEFFKLLKTGKGETDFCKRIEEQVDHARFHEEWRMEFMTLFMRDQENIEKGRVEGRAEGRTDAQTDNIKNIMDTLKYTLEQAMDLLKIPDSERDIYRLRLLR